MRGRNAYRWPKTMPWTSEQYTTKGMETAMYTKAKRSRRKTRA